MNKARPAPGPLHQKSPLEEQSARASRIFTIGVTIGLCSWIGGGALLLTMVWPR